MIFCFFEALKAPQQPPVLSSGIVFCRMKTGEAIDRGLTLLNIPRKLLSSVDNSVACITTSLAINRV